MKVGVDAALSPGYRRITFVVSDDGIGMSEDYLEHLFEPFVIEGRSRSQGTGLGMSIVRNIVTAAGGSRSARLPGCSAPRPGASTRTCSSPRTTSSAPR